MDWTTYKRLCDQPNVLSRWMLEQTAALVEDVALRQRLEAQLTRAPLPKPPDHRGGAATDMLEIDLSVVEAAQVEAAIARARAVGRTTEATRNRGIGGFVEAWWECRRYLENATSAPAASAPSTEPPATERPEENDDMAQIPVEAIVTGRVWKIEVAEGATVAEGDTLLILESMKMEIPIEAPAAGKVREILVAVEDPVDEGQIIAVLDS